MTDVEENLEGLPLSLLTDGRECGRCGATLTARNWFPSHQKKQWLICKPCSAGQNLAWRHKNLDKVRASRRRYYKKHGEELRAKSRAYRKAHYEEKKAKDWEYRLTHPHRYWAYHTIFGHRNRGYKIQLGINELIELAKKSINCAICGTPLTWTLGNGHLLNYPTLDRIDDSKILTFQNIQILCNRCNVTKSDR